MTRLLIAGLARSGTTWIGEALSAAERTAFVDEPDNHYRSPFAFRAKRDLPGRAYPRLQLGNVAPEYEALWMQAFGINLPRGAHSARARARRGLARQAHRGVLPRRLRRGPALTRRALADAGRAPLRLRAAARLALPEVPDAGARGIVVKSVYAARSLEWLAERLPVRVLVMRRDLRGVVASLKGVGWLPQACDPVEELGPGEGEVLAATAGVPPPTSPPTGVGRATWLLACMASELRDAAARHPEWEVASYEQLIADTGGLIPDLAARLDVGWSAAADAELRGPLAPPRRPPGIDPRLSAEEADEIASVLSAFDLRGWAW